MQILPIDNTPNQSFQSSLSVDGKILTLAFNVRYSDIAGYWVITITNPQTSTILLDSIPLLTCGNILSQYSYLQIGSIYLLNIGSDLDSPDDKSLGVGFIVAWGDTE